MLLSLSIVLFVLPLFYHYRNSLFTLSYARIRYSIVISCHIWLPDFQGIKSKANISNEHCNCNEEVIAELQCLRREKAMLERRRSTLDAAINVLFKSTKPEERRRKLV